MQPLTGNVPPTVAHRAAQGIALGKSRTNWPGCPRRAKGRGRPVVEDGAGRTACPATTTGAVYLDRIAHSRQITIRRGKISPTDSLKRAGAVARGP